MSLDMTAFDAALKVHYTDDRVQNMVYEDAPLLALLPKMEQFGGKNLPIPIWYGNSQNRSASFSTAVGQSSNESIEDFVLTRANDYSVAQIDNETMEASEGNANAFMEAAKTAIDGALHTLSRSLSIALYGTGSGKLGQLSATSGVTTLITLSEPEDVVNFEKGMELVLSTANGGGSVKTGSTIVTGVDRDAGTVTVATSLATFTAVGAVNDYIFAKGDYDAKIKGLLAWIPSTAPSSSAFFGVDRTQDATRLGGIRFDGSAMPIEEALVKAASRAAREGAKPDKCFISYSKYADLENSLGSKVQYVDLKATAEISFRGIQINGPRGPIQVVPDANCPNDRAFMLCMKTWKLYSLKKVPRIIDSDGLKMLRQSTADGVEIRAVYRAQLGCNAPGHNVNIKLA